MENEKEVPNHFPEEENDTPVVIYVGIGQYLHQNNSGNHTKSARNKVETKQ